MAKAPMMITPPMIPNVSALLASLTCSGFPLAATYLNPAKMMYKMTIGIAMISTTFKIATKRAGILLIDESSGFSSCFVP